MLASVVLIIQTKNSSNGDRIRCRNCWSQHSQWTRQHRHKFRPQTSRQRARWSQNQRNSWTNWIHIRCYNRPEEIWRTSPWLGRSATTQRMRSELKFLSLLSMETNWLDPRPHRCSAARFPVTCMRMNWFLYLRSVEPSGTCDWWWILWLISTEVMLLSPSQQRMQLSKLFDRYTFPHFIWFMSKQIIFWLVVRYSCKFLKCLNGCFGCSKLVDQCDIRRAVETDVEIINGNWVATYSWMIWKWKADGIWK